MARILLVGAEVNSDLAEAPKITKKKSLKKRYVILKTLDLAKQVY